MVNHSIRIGQSGDAGSISRLLQAMFTDVAQFGGPAVAPDEGAWGALPQTITDNLRDPAYRVFLATLPDPDAGPIGLAISHAVTLPRLFQSRIRLQVQALYVLPSHRRRGIARQLLIAALHWGAQAGCTEALLEVTVRNGAQALYRQLGFRVTELRLLRRLPVREVMAAPSEAG